jgi:hypothetical protein
MNKSYVISLCAALVISGFAPLAAPAATCANGPYAVGCAGPNGAAIARKPPYYGGPPSYYHSPPVYRPPSTIRCVNGVYRAGCAGPNGAAVIHKTY